MSATVISAQTRVEGSLLVGDPPGSGPSEGTRPGGTSSDLVIEGIVEGDVHTSGSLTLGRRAQVGGEIHAHDVRIGGVLHRSVRAEGVIHLLATAEVRGDLEAARVIIDDGAIFEGQVRLRRRGDAARAAPALRPRPVAASSSPLPAAADAATRPVVSAPAPITPPAARIVPELSTPGRRRVQRRSP
jgi:cytoskeletal protein CcmA (bactofilin family)